MSVRRRQLRAGMFQPDLLAGKRGSGQIGPGAYILGMTEKRAPVPHLLRRRWVVYGSAVVLVLVVALGLGWYLLNFGRQSAVGGAALIGGPFTLVDQHGHQVTDQDFAGRFMLIYFGYTFCPDVCPLSLANMVQAIAMLPPEQADQVVPIFITVDPERDTVAKMAEYAPLFDPRLVALTGSADQIRQAAKAYRIYYNKVENGGADDYLMDHSAFIYLMGPDGRYRSHFGHDAAPEKIAEALRAELAKG
jgi:cytochrome oxidase Cu insertion factor (SCO1/SenC/PrrC family)